MFFPPARYMEAVKQTDFSGVECNLAFSGITRPYSYTDLGIDLDVLKDDDFYAYGHPLLKELIAARYGVVAEQVLVPGGGTSLVNFLLSAALLSRGDQALVETPVYEPMLQTITASGAEIVALPRRCETGFSINLDEFALLCQPPVRLVVITRLHNPSGRDVSESTLLAMAQRVEEIDAYVLVDEVYLDFLSPQGRRSAASLHPRLISTASLTKVYGCGDLRLGWAVGPADLIWRCWRINNLLGVNPPQIPDRISVQLFQNGALARLGEFARQRARDNFPQVKLFASQCRHIEWTPPDAGIIAFCRLAKRQNAEPFISFLRQHYSTAVIAGSYFFQNDGFRLGFGAEPAQVQEGLQRLTSALEEFHS